MRPRVRTHTGRRDDHTDLCVAGRARASRIRAPETAPTCAAAAAAHPRWRATTVASAAKSFRRRRARRRDAPARLHAGGSGVRRARPGERAGRARGGAAVDMKRALTRAFDEAMSAGSDFAKADEAWTKAIAIAADQRGGVVEPRHETRSRRVAGRTRDDLERMRGAEPRPGRAGPTDAEQPGERGGRARAVGRCAMANYLEAVRIARWRASAAGRAGQVPGRAGGRCRADHAQDPAS